MCRECEVIYMSGDSVSARDNRELEDEECSLYRAIMLRVLQLEAEDWDYIPEFMDRQSSLVRAGPW